MAEKKRAIPNPGRSIKFGHRPKGVKRADSSADPRPKSLSGAFDNIKRELGFGKKKK